MKDCMLIVLILFFSPLSFGSQKVLFLMTAADSQELQNKKIRKTGYFLNEFYETYKELANAGITAEFASPGGKSPTIDEESLKERYWESQKDLKDALSEVDKIVGLKNPMPISIALAKIDEYRAIIVPGGQGVMVDLFFDNEAIGLIKKFGEEEKIVGLICHSPSLLLKMGDKNPFHGKEITSVSFFEELFIESFVMGGKAKVRLVGRSLEQKGFRHKAKFPGVGHALRDGKLITSQNPFSGRDFNKLLMEAIDEN